MESVSVRNLEQIQESDGGVRAGRLTTLFLASLGGAALVIATVMTIERNEPPATSENDPLAALVAKAKEADEDDVTRVDPEDLTFPTLLSDTSEPTTAAVAVKDARGRLVDPAKRATSPAPASPPPASDQLPVVPLPAGDILSATSVTTAPKDDMSALAQKLSTPELPDEHVPPGSEGAFQLQVASFKKVEDADRFVAELRTRGHRAFRQAAYVADRGLWHRVRIGPFSTKYAANQYKKEFEAKERMNTFVVDREKVKRHEDIKRAKRKAREEKDARRRRRRNQ